MAEIWKVIWSLCGALVAWILTVERRMAVRLTTKEHEQICDRRYSEFKEVQKAQHVQNTETLQRIEYLMDSSNKEARLYREKMQAEITEIKVKLASIQVRPYGRSS